MLAEFFELFKIDKDEYREIQDELNASNRMNLLIFSAVTAIVVAVLFFLSFFLETISYARIVYGIFAFLMSGIFLFCRKELLRLAETTETMVYVFMALILLFGLLIAVLDDPDTTSSVFIVLIFATPILFTVRPAKTNILIFTMTLLFLLCESRAKSEETFKVDMVNAVSFLALSAACSAYMMTVKINRYSAEHMNSILKNREIERTREEKELIYQKTYIDSLTGLLNRTAYWERFQEFQNGMPQGFTLISIDANGLKVTNDTLGHLAGDELLVGVAGCLRRSFTENADCYRMGGDEYLVIMDAEADKVKELIADFKEKLAGYESEHIHGISVACGCARAEEHPEMSPTELLKLADDEMYADKRAYHKSLEIKNDL